MIRNVRGFTLGEVLLVTAIMGIVLVLVLPPASGALDYYRIEREASALAGAFRYAQSQAIRRGKASGVQVVPDRPPSAMTGFDDGNWYRVLEKDTPAGPTMLHPTSNREFIRDFDDMSWGTPVSIISVDMGGSDFVLFSPEGVPSIPNAHVRISAGNQERMIRVSGVTGRIVVK